MPRNRNEEYSPKLKTFDPVVDDACEECLNLGWFPSDYGSAYEAIARCDNCAVFASDVAAADRAQLCLENPWPQDDRSDYYMMAQEIFETLGHRRRRTQNPRQPSKHADQEGLF